MINPQKGVITLCESGFTIHKHTKPQDLETNIPSLISKPHDYGNGYIGYTIWLDIDPQVYVSASVSFYRGTLASIRIYPQHQSTTIPAPQQYPMEIEKSHPLAYAWYCNHFTQDELYFRWGKIVYGKGDDPIYHPTVVLIEFY